MRQLQMHLLISDFQIYYELLQVKIYSALNCHPKYYIGTLSLKNDEQFFPHSSTLFELDYAYWSKQIS